MRGKHGRNLQRRGEKNQRRNRRNRREIGMMRSGIF
jgi:hypothetical protein